MVELAIHEAETTYDLKGLTLKELEYLREIVGKSKACDESGSIYRVIKEEIGIGW